MRNNANIFMHCLTCFGHSLHQYLTYAFSNTGIPLHHKVFFPFIYNTAFGNIQCMAKALRDTQAVDTQLS